MSNSIPVRQAPKPQRRLRTYGRALAPFATLAFGALLSFDIVVLTLGLPLGGMFVSMGPGSAYLGPLPALPGVVPFGLLPWASRLAYAATLVVDTAPILAALWQVRALGRLYARGIAFSARNGDHVRCIGLCLVACAVGPMLGRGIVLATGDGVDRDWFHLWELGALAFGLLLLAFAQASDVGGEIERDRDGFV